MSYLRRFMAWVNRLMAQALALWFCARHAGTPLLAKLCAIAVAAYAFSPIDLIPDFIPVLGFVDDALLLPIGIWLTLKLVPAPVLEECRAQATQWLAGNRAKPSNWIAAGIVVALWIITGYLVWKWFFA
jgi:uncharacterized membrane protein YkvA (DUF1232 family)